MFYPCLNKLLRRSVTKLPNRDIGDKLLVEVENNFQSSLSPGIWQLMMVEGNSYHFELVWAPARSPRQLHAKMVWYAGTTARSLPIAHVRRMKHGGTHVIISDVGTPCNLKTRIG